MVEETMIRIKYLIYQCSFSEFIASFTVLSVIVLLVAESTKKAVIIDSKLNFKSYYYWK